MSGKSVADATERLRLHGARGARGVVVGHSLPACLSAISLTPCEVRTPFGRVQLHRGIAGGAPLYVLYRHGRDTSSLARASLILDPSTSSVALSLSAPCCSLLLAA
jgi:hypothetical protein